MTVSGARLSDPVLSLNQLTERFGDHRGIEDVCLQVAAGEVFGAATEICVYFMMSPPSRYKDR